MKVKNKRKSIEKIKKNAPVTPTIDFIKLNYLSPIALGFVGQ